VGSMGRVWRTKSLKAGRPSLFIIKIAFVMGKCTLMLIFMHDSIYAVVRIHSFIY